MNKRLLFLFLIVFISFSGFSQRNKKYRYEFIIGAGPSGFLGDLGGSVGNGTHFVKDYNFSSTRFALNGGVRYHVQPKFAIKGMLTAGMVSGDDKNSKDSIRQNRNLNFRSPIIELAVQAEYYVFSDVKRNSYSIGGSRSRKKKTKIGAYIFAGVGVFFYSPQEQLGGVWYNVRQYHLEGQGLPGGPKQFSNVSLAIPMGIGIKQQLNKRFSLALEFGLRKTFTDYIDGVSTNYYDPIKLKQAYGPLAVALADPNLGRIEGQTNPGQERGNPKYKDSYMFITFNLGYKFNVGHKRGKTRAKF